jgi:hypothetical protein
LGRNLEGVESSDLALKGKFEALLPHLDERARRLYLASEADALGYGGVMKVYELTGVSRKTLRAGLDELQGRERVESGRVRRTGGGRKSKSDSVPGLLDALMELVDPEARGDPMSLLRWTTKSTRNLASALKEKGFDISHDVVAKMLVESGYSLQANAKTREGRQHPDRDEQFRYIQGQVTGHVEAGQPVISVDCKKKENVGPYKNGGREWRPAGKPRPVNMHDFPDPELGKAIPYGVYDVERNEGWINVGIDHETSTFAVESIRRWWNGDGVRTYPKAKRLLICADGGGSNGYRRRLWKRELAQLATDTGCEITVCHLPPGTSKWNKIEHRLFSHITMNWRGQPLTSLEVLVNLIGATTTRAGLRVRASLDEGSYPTKVEVTDEELAALPHTPHEFHGEWNYTLAPAKRRRKR